MLASATHGVPTWADLSTQDVRSAAGFYGELLGWTVQTHPSPMGEYHLAAIDGHEVGGMMETPQQAVGMPAAWTVIFRVGDVDAAVTAIEEAGGKTLEEPFDLPAARLAIVADPTGATFGIIAQPGPATTWLSARPGAVCWVELLTRDLATAITFYAGVFGWQASTEDHGGIRYTTFTLEGSAVGGAMTMPDEVPPVVPAVWSVYFAVEDCATSEHRAQELGAQVAKTTTPVGNGHFAVLEDPQGATFQLMDEHGTDAEA